MCFKLAVLSLVCLSYLKAQPVEFMPYGQIASPDLSDREPSETRHEDPHAAIQEGSKFFHYNPDKNHYGGGYEKGNDFHQDVHPQEEEFRSKVRWGDKNGGYGEHYYDYNHDGQQQNDEQQNDDQQQNDERPTKKKPQYEVREPEINQPTYITYGQAGQASILTPAYAPADNQRGKREQGLLKDVEFINDNARSLILDGNSQKHGGNYRRADDYRGKREHVINEEDLVFESDKGTFLDRKTGIEYELRPVYH